MPYIFISYSQKDRALANALADKLTAKGLGVWWDMELLGGEAFREAIEEKLHGAKIVIVLWSPNAVASRFVLDEADVAAATGKLVSVLLGDFKASQTPIGFRSFHSIQIADEKGLERTLQRRGLSFAPPPEVAAVPAVDYLMPEISQPNPVQQPEPLDHLDEASREEEAWKFVLAKKDEKLVADFLKQFPNSKYVDEAKRRKTLIYKHNWQVFPAVLIWFGSPIFGFFIYGAQGVIAGAIIGFGVSVILYWFLSAIFGDHSKALNEQEQKFLKKS